MKTNLDAIIERYSKTKDQICEFCQKNYGGIVCKQGDCPSVKETVEWLYQEYKEPIQLTIDEKIILKNISSEYNWIVRDENGDLFVFEKRPKKTSLYWIAEDDGMFSPLHLFEHIFQGITWEDEEPYSIAKLLKAGIVHE